MARRDDGDRRARRGSVGGSLGAGCGGRMTRRDDGGRLAQRKALAAARWLNQQLTPGTLHGLSLSTSTIKLFDLGAPLNFCVYVPYPERRETDLRSTTYDCHLWLRRGRRL